MEINNENMITLTDDKFSQMMNEYTDKYFEFTNIYKDLMNEPENTDETVPVRLYPKIQRNNPCPCNSGKKFKKCHGINSRVYIDTKNFYEFPLHLAKYGTWVYDKNHNFVFEFEDIERKECEKYVDLLNDEIESFDDCEYTTSPDDPTEICKDDKLFITIRGWGNLTGVGGYNFDGDTAAEIQYNFRDKILKKLNSNNLNL